MTENLKRCPFCGSEALIVDDDKEHYGVFIACSKCCSSTEIFKTEDEALIAWNTRPIEDLKDDENAWLEKNLKDYNRVMLENARLREALQMIATEKDNHGQWLSVEQAAQIAKDTLEG